MEGSIESHRGEAGEVAVDREGEGEEGGIEHLPRSPYSLASDDRKDEIFAAQNRWHSSVSSC